MNKKTIMLSMVEYNFVNDNGERVEGVTVNLVGDPLKGEGQRGYRVAKFSANQDMVKSVKSVPCLVDVEFDLKINAKNEASLGLKSLEFVKEYNLGV